MNAFDFLKYWMDTHPVMFGVVVILIAGGIAQMFANMFSKGDKSD